MAKKKHDDAQAENDNGSTALLDSAGNPLVPAQQSGGNGQAEKPTETKEERFKRLANKRFPRAVKAIKALTNLSNRAQYAYTEEQATVLLRKVFAAVDEMQAKFNGATLQSDAGLLFD